MRTSAVVAALRRQSRTSLSCRWASSRLALAFTISRSASSRTGSGLVSRSKIGQLLLGQALDDRPAVPRR